MLTPVFFFTVYVMPSDVFMMVCVIGDLTHQLQESHFVQNKDNGLMLLVVFSCNCLCEFKQFKLKVKLSQIRLFGSNKFKPSKQYLPELKLVIVQRVSSVPSVLISLITSVTAGVSPRIQWVRVLALFPANHRHLSLNVSAFCLFFLYFCLQPFRTSCFFSACSSVGTFETDS